MHTQHFKESLFLLKSYYSCIGRILPEKEEDCGVLVKKTLLPEGCGNPVESYFFTVEIPDEVDKEFLSQWLERTFGHDWIPGRLLIFTHPCDPRLLELARVGCKIYNVEDVYLTYKDGWVKGDPSLPTNKIKN